MCYKLVKHGEKALHSHADGKKHKKSLEDHEQVKNFFMPKNARNITKEPNETSEPVIVTTPVNLYQLQVQHHLMHPTLNHLMSVFKTQLGKRPKLCGH